MLGICQFCDFWHWVNYRFQAGLFAAVHFRQICPTISRGGQFWGIGKWCHVLFSIDKIHQNTFTKRHLQKNLPTHIPEHLQSLKNSSTWTAWIGILRFTVGEHGKICWSFRLAWWAGWACWFWKNVPVIFEMFRLYLTIYIYIYIYTTSYFWMSSWPLYFCWSVGS